MKIHLCSAYAVHNALDKLQQAAALNSAFTVCEQPEEADAILFVEDAHFDDYLFHQLAHHPHLKQWPHKCFMYNEVDRPWGLLPGLYCSMPQWSFEPNRHRAFPYVATPNANIEQAYKTGLSKEATQLFSFVGTGCNALRRRMIQLGRAQGGSIVDTSGFNVWDCDESEKQRQGVTFTETMVQSQFVLCPRGLGTSSFRLFETMQAGKTPVIIADSWVEPNHIDWSFAVRIKEEQLSSLGARLSSLASEAKDRGTAARAAWQRHYAPNKIFQSACDNILELQEDLHSERKHFIPALRREYVRADTAVMKVASQLKLYRRRLSHT